MYVFVKKLPADAVCCDLYRYPFKFGKLLYVYEPGLDCFGEAGFYRRSHRLDCPLANFLKGLDFYLPNL